MASTYHRPARSPQWLQHRFAHPDASGLRTAILVSTPISLALWTVILLFVTGTL